MKQREFFLCLVLTLLVLDVTGCRSVSQGKGGGIEPAPAPAQTQAQMAAGIHAATETLEAVLLMEFVRSPDQEFFDRAMAIVGRVFHELPKLSPEAVGMVFRCPGGSQHLCSGCFPMKPSLLCPERHDGPPWVHGSGAQTPAQMLAVMQASMSLLDAEIHARFVHTPNQRFFEEMTRILSRSFQELTGLISEGRGSGCPEGTVDVSRMCVAKDVYEALRTRRLP